jgi:hypothetical protein
VLCCAATVAVCSEADALAAGLVAVAAAAAAAFGFSNRYLCLCLCLSFILTSEGQFIGFPHTALGVRSGSGSSGSRSA